MKRPRDRHCAAVKNSETSAEDGEQRVRGALDLLTGLVLYLSPALHVNTISHCEGDSSPLQAHSKRPAAQCPCPPKKQRWTEIVMGNEWTEILDFAAFDIVLV